MRTGHPQGAPLLVSYDHGTGPLVGEEFAQQDVRLASIHDMYARDGGEGVEAGGDFGYHTAANDAVCYELFGLSLGQFGDERTVLAADAYDIAQEDQLFGIKRACQVSRYKVRVDIQAGAVWPLT